MALSLRANLKFVQFGYPAELSGIAAGGDGSRSGGRIDFILFVFIIVHMSMDRTLCAICAWRRDCKKKFSQGESVHCPDYTKDLTIRDKEQSQKETQTQSKKKPSNFHLL